MSLEMTEDEARALGILPPKAAPAPKDEPAADLSEDEARAMGILPARSFADKVKSKLGGAASAVGEFAKGTGQVMGDQLVAIGRGLENVATAGFRDNIKGAINAIDPTATGTMAEKYAHGEKTARDELAESREKAPVLSFVAEGVGNALLPGATTLVKGVGAGAKLARAGLAVAEGGVQAVGASDASTPTEAAEAFLKGGAIPGALHSGTAAVGLLTKPVAKAANWAIDKGLDKGTAGKGLAERVGDQILTRSITRGADSTHANRGLGTPEQVELVTDLIHRTPKLKAAVKSRDHEKMIEATDEVLEDLRPFTAPVYKAVDEKLGQIDVQRVIERIDDAIADVAKPGNSGQAGRIAGLEAMKARLVALGSAGKSAAPKDAGVMLKRAEQLREQAASQRYQGFEDRAAALEAEAAALARKSEPPAPPRTISTQDLRDETTGLLKQKFQIMGSLAETSGYVHKRENHELLNKILNERLDEAAKASPDLAGDVENLRKVNRDIAASLNIQTIAENASSRAARAAKGFDEQVGDFVKGGSMPAIAGAFAAGPAGLAIPLVAPAATGLARAGVFALQELGRKIRLGQATTKDIEDAVAKGVPRMLVQQLMKKRPENQQTESEDEQAVAN